MEIAGRVEAAEGAVASLWQQLGYGIPSRKLTVCYGKSPCLIGKSTIYGKWDYNVDHVEVIVDMIMWMTGYKRGLEWNYYGIDWQMWDKDKHWI